MAGNIVYRTTSFPLVPRSRVITDVSAFYGTTNAEILAQDSDVVAGMLYNLLTTIVGDEPFLPTFGCDLPLRVFEPINAKLLNEMFLDVYMTTKVWLPELGVSQNTCVAVAGASNRLAGVVIAYAYAGAAWSLPIDIVSLRKTY